MQPTDNIDQTFRRMLDTHGAIVNKVCYMYAESRDDFDDLRQEALINLWRGLDSYRGDADMTTWIYRVALNSCVSYFRRNRRPCHESIESLHALTADTDDRAGMLAEMHRLINRLDRIEKALILLWLDDYPYDTIAGIMAMPRNTVASRLRRIKEKLVKYSNE